MISSKKCSEPGLDRTSLEIVYWLYRNPSGLPVTDIIEKVAPALGKKKPTGSIVRKIAYLEKRKILKRRALGKARVITLNLDYEHLASVLMAAETVKLDEKVLPRFKEPLFKYAGILEKELSNTKKILWVFGSVAEGAPAKTSDVDLLLVLFVEHEKELQKIRAAEKKVAREIYRWFGVNLNAIVISFSEFKEKKTTPIIRQALETGIRVFSTHYLYPAEALLLE